MVEEALRNRPDIHAAEAQARGTDSAVKLARGDRIPTPVIGPEWEIDEAGVQYVGLVYITQIPIWNTGTPLVRQRQSEHQRATVATEVARQRAVAQVRAAVARWNGATDLVNDASRLTEELTKEVSVIERLFDAGQTDLTRLMQARERLIQLENSRLDCRLGRDAGPGGPPAGPGDAHADQRHARPGTTRRRADARPGGPPRLHRPDPRWTSADDGAPREARRPGVRGQ